MSEVLFPANESVATLMRADVLPRAQDSRKSAFGFIVSKRSSRCSGSRCRLDGELAPPELLDCRLWQPP